MMPRINDEHTRYTHDYSDALTTLKEPNLLISPCLPINHKTPTAPPPQSLQLLHSKTDSSNDVTWILITFTGSPTTVINHQKLRQTFNISPIEMTIWNN